MTKKESTNFLQRHRVVLLSYLSIIIGILVAYWRVPEAVQALAPLSDFSKFALFYIMAQAIERLLEPATKFADKMKDDIRQQNQENDEALIGVEAEIERIRANTRTILWAAATLLAMLSSGLLNLYLLRTIGITAAPPWLDVVVTGLAIGAGTQPLHDLIQKIENKAN